MSVLHPIRTHHDRCRETRAALTDLLDDELSPGERRRVESHLGRCPGCRRMLANLGRTVGALRRLGPGDSAA
jgi:anti-sigma factor RsiW